MRLGTDARARMLHRRNKQLIRMSSRWNMVRRKGGRVDGGVGTGWLSEDTEIISPKTFAQDIGVDRAILCFTPTVYETMIRQAGLAGRPEAPLFNGAEEGRIGDGMVVYRPCIGAPAAGMLMETLIACGVKEIIMIGLAGTISGSCAIGDLVVPTWGVREEGTSYHYLPADRKARPSEDMVGRLRRALSGVGCREGGVWTTDAPYRETMDKARRYSDKGVLAVDMECTAMMAIAEYRHASFAAVLAVTDILSETGWEQGFDSERVSGCVETACRLVRDCMRRA